MTTLITWRPRKGGGRATVCSTRSTLGRHCNPLFIIRSIFTFWLVYISLEVVFSLQFFGPVLITANDGDHAQMCSWV